MIPYDDIGLEGSSDTLGACVGAVLTWFLTAKPLQCRLSLSARAKKLLPAGALLWQWEADPEFEEAAGEQWMILLPKKWKQTTLYGWRFDPRELSGASRTQERPERPRNVRRCDLGDE